MTFDKPEHQNIVAQLIAQAQFPGSILELAFELKQAVGAASVVAPVEPEQHAEPEPADAI